MLKNKQCEKIELTKKIYENEYCHNKQTHLNILGKSCRTTTKMLLSTYRISGTLTISKFGYSGWLKYSIVVNWIILS